MRVLSKLFGSLLFGLAAALLSTSVAAQTYPNRLITLIVPYPAGGATDIMARMLGSKLTEAWGQTVVVDNRPGASGIIGTALVAKAPPDGYTLLLGITAMIQAPHLYDQLPYDAFKDFVPVSLLAHSADLFIVTSSVPANTLKEFVALVKANPKKYNYGSYGAGTSSHIHGEMLNRQAGLDLVHVSYKGSAPLMTDVLGGQVTAAFVDVASARSHLKSGKFKVLAVTGARRFKTLPEVPTFTELGYQAFDPYGWFGVFVPAGTPKDIVHKLSAETARIVRLPDVAARIDDLGLQAVGNSPDEFASVIKADAPIWGKVIKDANIKLD